MDGTFPWLLCSLLETELQEGPVPLMAGPSSDELGAMVSHPSHTVISDPGSSVSQRVQAVTSSPVSPVCWSESADDEELA